MQLRSGSHCSRDTFKASERFSDWRVWPSFKSLRAPVGSGDLGPEKNLDAADWAGANRTLSPIDQNPFLLALCSFCDCLDVHMSYVLMILKHISRGLKNNFFFDIEPRPTPYCSALTNST